MVKGFFVPSELGFIVNDLIVASFPEVFDIEFTARMEDHLDQIETAEAAPLEVLTQFYEPFKQRLENCLHADDQHEGGRFFNRSGLPPLQNPKTAYQDGEKWSFSGLQRISGV